jgi:hypothetical protein
VVRRAAGGFAFGAAFGALATIIGAALALAGCERDAAGTGAGVPGGDAAPAAPAAVTQEPAAPVDCTADGELRYVCGLANAEDIVPLADGDWLIASGMSPLQGAPVPGKLYLVDRAAKSSEELFPGVAVKFQVDYDVFGDCPGPIDTQRFSAHGLALRERAAGKYRLYMTSHGDREAIEAFDVDATGAKPDIAWVGCVVLPEHTFANSVAMLADGGFVATKFFDPADADGFAKIGRGEVTGLVYEWHPGGEVTAVPGTELSGPNGIELSADERYLWVAAFGTREVVRFDRRASPIAKTAVAVDVSPDNLRWGNDGKLYTAGANYVPPAECAAPPCATGWSVAVIDPSTLQATRVAGADQNAALQGASTALPVGNEIWIGTYNGDRIGYLPKQ